MMNAFNICSHSSFHVYNTVLLFGQRSLVGCSPWGLEESDMTEQLHFHFSLSCIGEGNGNPLQCSCLENPRDGGAWWAAIFEVAQSQTRPKWLSSSSRSMLYIRSPELIPHIASLYSLSNISSFPPTPSSWKPLFYFMLLWVQLLWIPHIKSYSSCL